MGVRPYVIILNGVGSVGKTATARALQSIIETPFLHVSMDVFAEMLPQRMFGHPDGMVFESVFDQGNPSVIIRTGDVMARAMSGMRHAIAGMAFAGNDIIMDDVMMAPAEADEYRTLLSDADLRFVGLHASLAVLEERERSRGDRELGLARWQFGRVHYGQRYDLEIDTSASTVAQNAHLIAEAFGLRLLT